MPMVSIVIPAHNEAENLKSLLSEVARVMLEYGKEYEIIVVDDGSDDETPAILKNLKEVIPALRSFRHSQRRGQSSALYTGVESAKYSTIVTLDGDGQNPPYEIVKMLKVFFDRSNLDMLVGWRRRRRDPWTKKVATSIANQIRRLVLNDQIHDSGCGLKVFKREMFLKLPPLDHMHRFLPFLFQMLGGNVAELEVDHRPRSKGKGHYGNLSRAISGIIDMLGMLWLKRRYLLNREVKETW